MWQNSGGSVHCQWFPNWARVLIVTAGVGFATAACSRQDSGKPNQGAGSGPISYATNAGASGGSSKNAAAAGAGGSFVSMPGGEASGGAQDGYKAGRRVKGLRHKNMTGSGDSSDSGGEPAIGPDVTLQIPPQLIDAVAPSAMTIPPSDDYLPGDVQTVSADDAPPAIAAPLPPVVWTGLALLCAIPLVSVIADRRVRPTPR